MHREAFEESAGTPFGERPQKEQSLTKQRERRIRGIYIPAISVVGVFFVCSFLNFVLKNIPLTAPYAFFSLLAALPSCSIVLTVFSFIWWNRVLQAASISALIWSVGFCIVRVLSFFWPDTVEKGGVYVSCLLLQIINVLVFLFVYSLKKSRSA